MHTVLHERYLETLKVHKRLAVRSLEIYARALALLAKFAEKQRLPCERLQNQHLRNAVASLHSKGWAPRTIAQTLSAWRGFYHWLGQEGLLAKNPCLGLKAPKKNRPLPKALSLQESQQLADYQNTQAKDSALEIRDAAIVELLYSSGLRVGELVAIDIEASPQAKAWIDAQAGLVFVLGKGSKWRSVPVGQTALNALQHWRTVRANNPKNQEQAALFTGRNGTRLSAQTIWQRLRQRSVLAGLGAPVHPHMLRHSFASHVLQASQDLRAVQEMMGHASIASTQVYTRLDFEHLAAVYAKSHPRAAPTHSKGTDFSNAPVSSDISRHAQKPLAPKKP